MITKRWWNNVFQKTIETIISVKVLTIAAVLTISTCMVYAGKMDGSTFAQLNGALISTVYALREGFKIMSVKEYQKQGRDERPRKDEKTIDYENKAEERKMMV